MPFMRPMVPWYAPKRGPDALPMRATTNMDIGIGMSTARVSRQSSTIMIVSNAAICTNAQKMASRFWLSSWSTESTSLVTRLMRSPVRLRSKNRMDNVCSRAERSWRIVAITRCAIRAINRLYISDVTQASR